MMSFAYTLNATTKECSIKPKLGLVTKILSLIEHDGLLGKKLLLLDAGGKLEDHKMLDLINLESMAYWGLSLDVLPFLAQTPDLLDCNIIQLSEKFVRNVVNLNMFGSILSENSCSLCLRVSLFNHSYKPNCFQINLGDSMAVFALCDIEKGDELTIAYVNDAEKNSNTILFNKWGI